MAWHDGVRSFYMRRNTVSTWLFDFSCSEARRKSTNLHPPKRIIYHLKPLKQQVKAVLAAWRRRDFPFGLIFYILWKMLARRSDCLWVLIKYETSCAVEIAFCYATRLVVGRPSRNSKVNTHNGPASSYWSAVSHTGHCTLILLGKK